MAGFTVGLIALGVIARGLGYAISFDWDDPDFMKLRKGKSVIDITGGRATYVRTFMRIVNAVYMQADPTVSHADAKKYSKFAAQSLSNFWRNKLAPNTSYAVNAFMGENAIGEKFNPWEIIQVYPMYTDDIIEAFEKGTPENLAIVLPVSILGLGYMEYEKDIRKAQLSVFLDKDKDKKVISFLKQHQLNVTSDVNQEIYDPNKGTVSKMTREQADRYEKLWSEYIIDELKDGGMTELSKLKEAKFKKEFNSIKFAANRWAKSQITGVADGVQKIRKDDVTYSLTPEQVKERMEIIKEYMRDQGQDFIDDISETLMDEGIGKVQAKRKATVKTLSKANSYSANVMIEKYTDKDDKITLKEQEEK